MNRVLIGKRIESFRHKNGISTLDLAEKIGKSQATVSRIENGKQGISIEMLASIAAIFKVHPFALLSEQPLRHSVLLPAPSAAQSDAPLRITAIILHASRLAVGIEREEAAQRLAIGCEELEAIELGYALPDRETLELIIEMYPVERSLLISLVRIESEMPEVSERMALMHHFLGMTVTVLQGRRELLLAYPDLDRLYSEMRACFGENNMNAFSSRSSSVGVMGNFSDCLVKALQNPNFHDKMEAMARIENITPDWEQVEKDVLEQ